MTKCKHCGKALLPPINKSEPTPTICADCTNITIGHAARNLYAEAVAKWGEHAQSMVMIEEMAELTQSIIHVHRKRLMWMDIADEVADVLIMAEQLRLICNAPTVDDFKERKLQRLRKRIDRQYPAMEDGE